MIAEALLLIALTVLRVVREQARHDAALQQTIAHTLALQHDRPLGFTVDVAAP